MQGLDAGLCARHAQRCVSSVSSMSYNMLYAAACCMTTSGWQGSACRCSLMLSESTVPQQCTKAGEDSTKPEINTSRHRLQCKCSLQSLHHTKWMSMGAWVAYSIHRVMKSHSEGVALSGDFIAIVAGQQRPQHCVVCVQRPLHHLAVPARRGSQAA